MLYLIRQFSRLFFSSILGFDQNEREKRLVNNFTPPLLSLKKYQHQLNFEETIVSHITKTPN